MLESFDQVLEFHRNITICDLLGMGCSEGFLASLLKYGFRPKLEYQREMSMVEMLPRLEHLA